MDFVLELARLIKKAPKHHLPMQDCENCPYNSFLYKSKDCYLSYSSSFLESCLYVDTASYDKDCVDCDYISHCELCYARMDCNSCYNCTFCQDCKNCTDCLLCYECHGCTNCFGCVGLYKKEFHIFNIRYTRKGFEEKIMEVKNMSPHEIEAKVNTLRLAFPRPQMHAIGCDNTYGDYIKNSKNCFMCFNAEKCEDSGYLYDEIADVKDCYDCSHIQSCQWCYNLMSAYQCYNVDFSWWMVNCRDCSYGFCNNGCSNCFGCVNIQRREYQILNQPCRKEEYFKKVAQIKEDLRKRNLYGKYLLMDAVETARKM